VVCRDAGAQLLLIAVISCMGILAIDRRAYGSGARLLGRGDAGPTGSWWLLPDQRRAFEECQLKARAALGEHDFANALAEGQALTLDEAVELALTEREQKSLN